MEKLPWTDEEVNYALGRNQTICDQEWRQQIRPFPKTKKKKTKHHNLRLFNQRRLNFNENVKNL